MTLKRWADIAVAGSLVILLFPWLLLLALLIRMRLGSPVFFIQPRLGHRGRRFFLYKFRTMTNERDERGNLLPDERRLTRLGKFLRRASLDEFPTLINVLRGEMSLVGPRPLLVEYRDLYTPEQWRRHEVRPGLTGLVQIKGRNLLSWEEKFAWDVYYVDNWSLGLDIRILCQTLFTLFKNEGISARGHATMPRYKGTRRDSSRSGGH
ncbi:MAG: sugar transferase [Acidobacteriota bacterium]|nr:sugar transferase [Acidobacteriota bacterium]